MTAYFIMGRSSNSRNRVFVEDGEGIRTQAFDESKLEDPSLIIYAPVRVLGNKTIVTNGDQTDTIYECMDKQMTFEQALRTREFEPDAPNYTPRISAVLHIENGQYNYAMSILKSNNGNPDSCNRFTLPIITARRERDILFPPICMTEILCRALRVSQSFWIFRMIWMPSRICSGRASTRRIRFPCLFVILILRQGFTNPRLSIRINNREACGAPKCRGHRKCTE